jgi:hypothetical protein
VEKFGLNYEKNMGTSVPPPPPERNDNEIDRNK